MTVLPVSDMAPTTLGIPLAYIFPAMFHYKTHPNRRSRIFDIPLIVFGSITMIYTTFNTVYDGSKNRKGLFRSVAVTISICSGFIEGPHQVLKS
jgi:hypothetical protein